MSSSPNYEVLVGKYAERHYIKDFSKKYHSAWDITLSAVKAELARIDTVIGQTDRAETISVAGEFKLGKLNFSVAGTRISAKSSGNRVIFIIDESLLRVTILLVYTKTDIGPPNETQKWQNEVKAAYPEIWARFS